MVLARTFYLRSKDEVIVEPKPTFFFTGLLPPFTLLSSGLTVSDANVFDYEFAFLGEFMPMKSYTTDFLNFFYHPPARLAIAAFLVAYVY